VISVQPDGSIRHHPGGWAACRKAEIARPALRPPKPSKVRGGTTDHATRLSSSEQHEYRQIEKQIPKLERRIASLEADLGGFGTDWEKAAALGSRLTKARSELARIEDRWLNLADRSS